MIRTEIRQINGVDYQYTYSDAGMMIERDGEMYEEAYDPLNSGRTYTETNVPIDGAATDEDYEDALTSLGVEL